MKYGDKDVNWELLELERSDDIEPSGATFRETAREQARADWEDKANAEWWEWQDKILSTPGLFRGEPEDLDRLRYEYVPDEVGKCPHCENSRKTVLRERWWNERLLTLHADMAYCYWLRIGNLLCLLGVCCLLFALVLHYVNAGQVSGN